MGQGSRSSGLSSVDFYRRVPKDLTEVRMMGGGLTGQKDNCFGIFSYVGRTMKYMVTRNGIAQRLRD